MQKYIKDVKLWHGRKFDLRTFVLLTNSNGSPKVHFHPGFMRCSIDEYNPDYFVNSFCHYTNITKQRLNPQFEAKRDSI